MTRATTWTLCGLLAAGVICSGVGAASAGSFVFTKIVDESDVVPGVGVNFNGFNFAAPNGSGDVTFLGHWIGPPTFPSGLFVSNGGPITPIADFDTDIPEGASKFASFVVNTMLPFDGETIAFGGRNESGTERGIYRWDAGALTKVVDRGDPVPGVPGGEFFAISGGSGPWLSNGHVAFTNRDTAGSYAAYAVIGGALQIVADQSTPEPGGTGNFVDALARTIDRDGTVVFLGELPSGDLGIYSWLGGAITPLFDQSATMPGTTVTFESFGGGFSGAMDIDQGVIVFQGMGIRRNLDDSIDVLGGIYRYEAGALTKIIDCSDPAPGVPDGFKISDHGGGLTICDAFNEVSYHGGNVVFDASLDPDTDPWNGNDYRAIFTDLGGALTKLVAEGETFDGGVVRHLRIGSDPVRGDEIAFWVHFEDRTSAVYLVRWEEFVIPEPSTLVLGALGALVTGLALRRRRR